MIESSNSKLFMLNTKLMSNKKLVIYTVMYIWLWLKAKKNKWIVKIGPSKKVYKKIIKTYSNAFFFSNRKCLQ